jgi:hypothetical protein
MARTSATTAIVVKAIASRIHSPAGKTRTRDRRRQAMPSTLLSNCSSRRRLAKDAYSNQQGSDGNATINT